MTHELKCTRGTLHLKNRGGHNVLCIDGLREFYSVPRGGTYYLLVQPLPHSEDALGQRWAYTSGARRGASSSTRGGARG